ncbi:MAG: hypothetical protein JEY91_19455 [Spirochaetaceae bacterium]|nr:hypothetical protein [Spirochaetaceae bacterium]
MAQKFIVILFLLMMNTSCMSLLVMHVYKSSQYLADPEEKAVGLLLIPHSAEIKDTMTLGNYQYFFESLRGDKVKKFIIPPYIGTGKIYLEPGKYVLNKIQYINENKSREPVSEIPTIYFEIEKGKITVLPLKFTTRVLLDPENRYLHWISGNYEKTSELDKEEAIASISDKKNFELWAIK